MNNQLQDGKVNAAIQLVMLLLQMQIRRDETMFQGNMSKTNISGGVGTSA